MNNTEVSDQNHHENHVSVCDIMKGSTSEIIRKFESQIPSLLQNYSNLYTAYLHVFDDLFGTCYIHEKEFFDKLNIDEALLKQLKNNSESIKNRYLENIEITAKFFDEQFKMRISSIQSFENFARIMMDSYAKTLSQYNQSFTTSQQFH
jgi:hypothetical protein